MSEVNESNYEACVAKLMRENRLKNIAAYLLDLGKTIGTIVVILVAIIVACVVAALVVYYVGYCVLWPLLCQLYGWIMANPVLVAGSIIVLSLPVAAYSVYCGYVEYALHESRYECRKLWKAAGREIDAEADKRVELREDEYGARKVWVFGAWVVMGIVACLLLLSAVDTSLPLAIVGIAVCGLICLAVPGMFCGFAGMEHEI